MKRILFICNTVYQVFVAMWINYRLLQNECVDIIITDHMNDSQSIFKRLNSCEAFNKCYYARTRVFCSYEKENHFSTAFSNLFPILTVEHLISNELESYDDLYFANFNRFTTAITSAVSKNNQELKLHLFEDGFGTYGDFCKSKYYNEAVLSSFKKTIYKCLYNIEPLRNRIVDINVFSPERMLWKPNAEIKRIPVISDSFYDFKNICNYVFEYDSSCCINQHYIFFDQYFGISDIFNDKSIVSDILKKVGKENLIVKLHPRRPADDYIELGINTYNGNSIPWEVIVMNMPNLNEKTLITIASTCVLTPSIVFGKSSRAYSIFDLIERGYDNDERKETVFQSIYTDSVRKQLSQYSDILHFVKSVDEIV